MRLILLGLGCALTMFAGVIQGVVLEWASGKPLSRTIVHLQPVPGGGAQTRPLQTRSGRSGQFQFVSVPDGLYLLETQREGFLPAAYGQRRPTSYGTPIAVTKDFALFAELRAHRMGALTGTVLDENSVGLPRVNVVASTDLVNIAVRHAATRAPLRIPVTLTGRRDDLSGAEPTREIPLPAARLGTGYWEFTAAVGTAHYVRSSATDGGDIRRTRRATRRFEWFGVYLEPFRAGDRISIFVSDRAAQLSGVATQEGKRVPGIPVFLWPVKEETRRMLGGTRQVLTDVDGRYQFTGLPPGEYRVLATMDIREIGAEVAEEAKAIGLTEGQSAEMELSVWIAP